MAGKIRGMVAEVDGDNCIIISPQGEFLRVKRRSRSLTVGQEVELNRPSFVWPKIAAAVAAVILLSVIIPFYPLLTASAQPEAYLSLDINPSLELGISQTGSVVATKEYNSDGRRLVTESSVSKANIYNAVQNLLTMAIKDGYLAHNKPNLVVVAYTGDGKFAIDQQKLHAIISRQILAANLQAQVLVVPTSMEIRKEANTKQISAGKFLVFEAAKAKGINLDLDSLKVHGINQTLLDEHLKIDDLESGLSKVEPDNSAKRNEDRQLIPPKTPPAGKTERPEQKTNEGYKHPARSDESGGQARFNGQPEVSPGTNNTLPSKPEQPQQKPVHQDEERGNNSKH